MTIPISLLKEISLSLPDQSKLPWFKEMYLKMINERKKGNTEKASEIMKDVCNKIEENLKKFTLITLNHREQNDGCETRFPLN